MRELFLVGALSAAVLVVVISASLGLIYWIGPKHCDARWPDRNPEWGIWSGCMVEHNGQMVPEDRIWFERNA